MKVSEIILKGIGFWLLAVLSNVIVFVSYFIGHMANGLDPMFVSMIISILMSTEILLVLLVRYFFKLPEETEELKE